jgi:hypothetical protein
VQLAQRLTDGLLSGKTVQGGRFPVPVSDHRVQVLDNHGFAAVFEHLREVTGARFRSLVFGTVNSVWLGDQHRLKLRSGWERVRVRSRRMEYGKCDRSHHSDRAGASTAVGEAQADPCTGTMQRTIGQKKAICATKRRSQATAGSGQMGAPVRNSQGDQRR